MKQCRLVKAESLEAISTGQRPVLISRLIFRPEGAMAIALSGLGKLMQYFTGALPRAIAFALSGRKTLN